MDENLGAPLFDRVALIGIGLINSSLARIIRRDGLAREITACARTRRTLDKVKELGLADSVTTDPAVAVAKADLVVLGTPLGAYREVTENMASGLEPGCIVTDVGSVKACLERDVAPFLPEGVHLVPGHPIAGTEHSGPEAGFAELFEGRWCVLTPAQGTDGVAVDRVAELWRRCGMTVQMMDGAHHDKVLAITSHVPHLIAYTIVGTATDLEGDLRDEVVKFSAGGFRDFTRIAGSDPTMWRDVFLTNREAVLEMLGRFSEDLVALRRAIRRSEGQLLYDVFDRTREIRRGVIDAGQHIPPKGPKDNGD